MTDPAPPPPIPTDPNSRLMIRALAVWLTAQLIVTALLVVRVQFWNAGGNDSDALTIMLIAQIALSSMLLDLLFASPKCSIMVVLAAIPFIQIAAVLSATPIAHAISSGSIAALWMIALAAWASVARSRFSRALLTAVATLISAGGMVMLYITREFANSEINATYFGPLTSATSHSSLALVATAVLAALSVLAASVYPPRR